MDADWLLQDLDARGAATVIPSKANRKQRDYDREAGKWQHLVKDFFSKFNEFRGIEARNDKTDASYTAWRDLAAILIASG